MIPTSRLPGTVLRSSAERPCTSALGLFTRRYSAGKSNVSPPSKLTVSVLRSLCRRNSLGQAGVSVLTSRHVTYRARAGDVVTAEFLDAGDEFRVGHELDQRLQGRLEIIALANHEIEVLPDDRHKAGAGGVGDAARRNASIGAANADRLRHVSARGADRADGGKAIERTFRLVQKREQ